MFKGIILAAVLYGCETWCFTLGEEYGMNVKGTIKLLFCGTFHPFIWGPKQVKFPKRWLLSFFRILVSGKIPEN